MSDSIATIETESIKHMKLLHIITSAKTYEMSLISSQLGTWYIPEYLQMSTNCINATRISPIKKSPKSPSRSLYDWYKYQPTNIKASSERAQGEIESLGR